MEKRKEQEHKEASEYYKLKTEAVENLVTANAENSPKVPEEELRKYRRNSSSIRIPEWLKVLFVKFWFAGAVCYFVVWGLGLYIGSVLDLLFVASVIMGFVTDLLANNVIRFLEEVPGANEKWIMVRKRRYVSLILNLFYSVIIMACVYFFYEFVNIAITSATGDTESVPLGVEPLLFGILYMGFDLMFIGLKALIVRIFSGAERKEKEGGVR